MHMLCNATILAKTTKDVNTKYMNSQYDYTFVILQITISY